MSASAGRLVVTVPEVLADLPGAIRRAPGGRCSIKTSYQRTVRDLRDVHRAPADAMANIVPERWWDRAL